MTGHCWIYLDQLPRDYHETSLLIVWPNRDNTHCVGGCRGCRPMLPSATPVPPNSSFMATGSSAEAYQVLSACVTVTKKIKVLLLSFALLDPGEPRYISPAKISVGLMFPLQ